MARLRSLFAWLDNSLAGDAIGMVALTMIFFGGIWVAWGMLG